MPFDSGLQRKIMGRFATGVTVVTTGVEGRHGGLTANAVCSLSLDPPLVLVAVDKKAGSHAELREHRYFALNILALDQQEISQRFAKPGPKDFTGLKWKTATTGAPIFEGVLGWLDCRVAEILPGGDHDIFVGEIVAGELGDESPPLLYFSGGYRRLADQTVTNAGPTG
ncbi:MAG: flavin reductase family protein [Planctomycetaceae bacterium]